MKDKNKIFFGEKGISSTSANHLANIAKQMVDQENAILDSTSFVTTQVKLLVSGSEAIIQTGNNDYFIKEIPEIIKKISEMNAFCAWMREAIKAREEELAILNTMTLDDFCKIQNIEIERIPVRDEYITEADAIGKIFNIAERFRYYELEAQASTIGKYIHPGNKFYNARLNMHSKTCNPNSVNGSGSEMAVYSYSPSCSVDKVEETFMKLQSDHRALEASLNSMKFKVKEFVENHRAEVNRKHQKAISDSVSKKDELTARMNVFIDEEKAKLLSLKIIVPNFLERTFKYFSSL